VHSASIGLLRPSSGTEVQDLQSKWTRVKSILHFKGFNKSVEVDGNMYFITSLTQHNGMNSIKIFAATQAAPSMNTRYQSTPLKRKTFYISQISKYFLRMCTWLLNAVLQCLKMVEEDLTCFMHCWIE
jgi:hypothetical protein